MDSKTREGTTIDEKETKQSKEQKQRTKAKTEQLRGSQLIAVVLFILFILSILSGSYRLTRPRFAFELRPPSTEVEQQAGIQLGRGR